MTDTEVNILLNIRICTRRSEKMTYAAAPHPAIARPAMSMLIESARAQIRLPISKMTMDPM